MSSVWNWIESSLQHVLLALDSVFASVPLTRPWSWAAAVVVLTLLLRMALLPAVALQLRFTRRMAELEPQISEIRSRHGLDEGRSLKRPGRLAKNWVKAEEEQDALLKEHGVRWWVGLLPALVQIPAVVAVLRLLGSQERTAGLTPATWAPVPPPTTTFLHHDEGRVLLAVLAVLTSVLALVGQRQSIARAASPPSGLARRVRLGVVPPAVGVLALNLPVAIVVSLLTSLVWGLVQAVWVKPREVPESRPLEASVR